MSRLEGTILPNFKKQIDGILSNFNQDKGNLIPILQQVQQNFGYLPEDVLQTVADFLRLSSSTIYSICTFYSHFKLTPPGRKVVKMCRGTACHVRGGAQILADIERRLSIKPGETTEDTEYSLETVACVGACALAPVMIINDRVYGKMSINKVMELFDNDGKNS